MIQKIRRLVAARMKAHSHEWIGIVKNPNLSAKEKVLVVCMMVYYFRNQYELTTEATALFSSCLDSVKREKIDQTEENLDDDYSLEMALADTLLDMIETTISAETKETDLEVVAERMYAEFFNDKGESCD